MQGSTAANKLISGTGNDVMRGGSGNDILSASGATSTGGSRLIFGDGLADGGSAGVDEFRILGGVNLIADYETGEDLFLNSLNPQGGPTSGIVLTQINLGGEATWAARFTGSTHQTFVELGTVSTTSQAQAGAALNFLLANDLTVDTALIA